MQNRVAVVGARLGKGTSLLLFTRLCSYTGPFNFFFFQVNFVAYFEWITRYRISMSSDCCQLCHVRV